MMEVVQVAQNLLDQNLGLVLQVVLHKLGVLPKIYPRCILLRLLHTKCYSWKMDFPLTTQL